MSLCVEQGVVAALVLLSLLIVLKTLLPFSWRVGLARRMAGKVPDRLRIWLAGRSACDACGRRSGLG